LRRRASEQPQLLHQDFDLAGIKVRVHHLRRPGIDHAPDRNDVLVPEHAGLDVSVRILFGVEDHLGQAVPVPQVHEDEAAVVPAALHPAHEHHFHPGVGEPQDPAGMAALQPF
jgi:hypothetical protein